MVEKWSLRLRTFLFFALIGLGAVALIGGAMVLAARRIGADAVPHLVLFGGGAGFAICGLTLWVWTKFDENVVRPIDRLARDMRAVVHGKAARPIDGAAARYLGFLAPAASDFATALADARSQVDEAVREATLEVERQKSRLEAVLRDLQEAVLICALDHTILLYNRRALEILHVSGDLGLGRSLFEVMSAQPFRHALERLTLRFDEARADEEGLSTLIVCATADGRHTLRGHVSLFLDAEGARPMGYVATFSDATRELAEQAKRDRLLHTATGELRRPAASLQAVAEMLAGSPDVDADGRKEFERILVDEATALSERLQQLEADSRDLLAGAWPMSDVESATLFHCLLGKPGRQGAGIRIAGDSLRLHCDSLTIVELLDHVLQRLAATGEAKDLTLQAVAGKTNVYLEVAWRGRVVSSPVLDDWMASQLDGDLGGITGRDVLDRHKSELWCESRAGAAGEPGARLRLPLPPAKDVRDQSTVRPQRVPERPEFYDFDLLRQIDPAAVADTPLRTATYVVFDTETTGLEPSAGDEIVSIAGIRIVNGRTLRGETFDQLVNPGRPIPAPSTRVHGIDDAMVASAPDIRAVLPRFRRFAGDAVLVAHNAAFDMKFLTLRQDECGVRFDHPVLDTVLLAAHVHGTLDDLTLDHLAERYGIRLLDQDRHTALGDAIATAEVLLRLIDLLAAAGVHTLRDAITASNELVAIRRQQAKY